MHKIISYRTNLKGIRTNLHTDMYEYDDDNVNLLGTLIVAITIDGLEVGWATKMLGPALDVRFPMLNSIVVDELCALISSVLSDEFMATIDYVDLVEYLYSKVEFTIGKETRGVLYIGMMNDASNRDPDLEI